MVFQICDEKRYYSIYNLGTTGYPFRKIKLVPNFSVLNQNTFQMDQIVQYKISVTIKMLEEKIH